jgi:hypothetical protein
MARLLKFGTDRKFTEVVIEKFEDLYKAIGCDLVELTRRKVGGKYFDIYVDEEGLLKEAPEVTAVNRDCDCPLVGSLVFANRDDEGDVDSLSDNDIRRIKASTVSIGTASPDGFEGITRAVLADL